MRRSLLPRLGDFVFVIVFVGCMLLGQRMLNVDGDLGRHLTLGRYMLETGKVPVNDVLSFSRAGESRPPYEWLSQIALAAAYRLLGLDGVVLLTAIAIATAFWLAYDDASGRTASPVLSLIFTVWAAAASSLHWLTRPHVFTFVLLVIWIRLLEQMRVDRGRGFWKLPLVMLLWANMHAGFVFGFLAWAAYVVGWAWDWRRGRGPRVLGARYAMAGVGALIASIMTPDLWGNWTAVAGNGSAYLLARTTETMPVNLATPDMWPFLTLMLLGVVLAIMARRTLAPAHAALLLGFGALALVVVRNIPLYCLVAAPIVAEHARRVFESSSSFRHLESRILSLESGLTGSLWPMAAVLMAGIFLTVHAARSRQAFYRFDAAVFPVTAIDWVSEHSVQGRMLNELNWGGYILFRLWPEQRVFIDSQSDFYGEELVRQYDSALSGGDGWSARLETWQVDWMILAPGSPLATLVERELEWQVSYEDATAVVVFRAQD